MAPAGASAQLPSGQLYGFNEALWRLDGMNRGALFNEFLATAPDLWRINVHWSWYEGAGPGQINEEYFGPQSHTVELYNELTSRGMAPVLILTGSPAWARPDGYGAGCTGSCFTPPDLSREDVVERWRAFAATVATTFDEAVIEVWNEPNLPGTWNGPQDPALYAAALREAADAIHDARPGAIVLGGGLSNYGMLAGQGDTSQRTTYQTMLRAMYDVAGAQSFDGISYHAYPCGGPTDTSHVAGVTSTVRQIAAEKGDAGVPLWLTEMGGTTGAPSEANCLGPAYTEAQQAQVLGTHLDWAKAQFQSVGDLRAILVHSVIDVTPRNFLLPAQPNPQGEEFGVVSWTKNLGIGAPVLRRKPSHARVSCEFRDTC